MPLSELVLIAASVAVLLVVLPVIFRGTSGWWRGNFEETDLCRLGALTAAVAIVCAGVAGGAVLHGVALVGFKASILLFGTFTAQVFRRGQPLGTLILVAISVSAGVSGALDFAALGADGVPPGSGAFSFGQFVTAVPFAWIAVECGLAWSRERRRRTVGLGDPILRNRFGLFSLAGAIAVAICATRLAESLAAIAHPTANGIVAAAHAGLAVVLPLALTPPAAYERWIRGDAAGVPTAD